MRSPYKKTTGHLTNLKIEIKYSIIQCRATNISFKETSKCRIHSQICSSSIEKETSPVVLKDLPHWAQAGTICFITWRTADSLPISALERITKERRELAISNQWNPNSDWKSAIADLPPKKRAELHWAAFLSWDQQLDNAAGACVLRQTDISEIVLKSLLHFDGDRYVLTDAVVMPNHVHLLAAFRDEASLEKQCTSWKHFSATEINKRMHQSGEFWQVDQFDHLVRDLEDFEKYRSYIADNPKKAGLKQGSFQYYSS